MFRVGCLLLIGSVYSLLTGCCCVPPNGCGSVAGPMAMSGGSSCDSRGCDTYHGSGLLDSGCSDGCGFGSNLAGLAGLTSCRGACDEVYVDEWINERPTPDNCGYSCECGNCDQCCPRPVLTVLKRLWGRRYVASCDSSFLCGGCDSCSTSAPSCGCGECQSGGVVMDSNVYMEPQSNLAPSYTAPAEIMPSSPTVVPEAVPSATGPEPTVAPTVSPSSRRINPAARRRGYSQT